MIDEFIEFLLVPVIALLVHVILICINYWMLRREGAPNFVVINCIIWLLITFLTFPLLLAMVLSITSAWMLAHVSLALMFIQLSLNIERMLDYNKKKEKYR